MISNETFSSVTPIAEALANNGITLRVMPGTPLYELTRLSAPIFDVPNTNPAVDPAAAPTGGVTVTQVFGKVLEKTTKGVGEDDTMHDRELAVQAEQLASVVLPHIAYAKNVVSPLRKQLAEIISGYFERNPAVNPTKDFNITVEKYPAFLDDMSFMDSLARYKDMTIVPPKTPLVFHGTRTQVELIEMMQTGFTRVDKDIAQWASNINSGELSGIWMGVFCQGASTESHIRNLSDISSFELFKKLRTILVIHLLCRNLTQRPDKSVKMSDAMYRNAVGVYLDWSGAFLISAIAAVKSAIATRILITNRSDSRNMVVNGVVYEDWVAKGNDPEILLGVLISGDRVMSQDAIDAKSKTYLRQWENYESLYRARENVVAHERIRASYIDAFFSLLGTQDPVEKDYISKNPNHLEICKLRAKTYIENLPTSRLKDFDEIALELSAGCRFYFTAAHQILSDIDEIGRINPDSDPREAAFLAVINYLVDYAATQVGFVKNVA